MTFSKKKDFYLKRKWFLKKPMKPILDIFINFFLCFLLVARAGDEPVFNKFLCLLTETGNANSSFWCMLKRNNVKIKM